MNAEFPFKRFTQYLGMVLKRWQLSVIVFVGVFATVVILTLRQQYVYEASTKLVIGESMNQRALGNTLDGYQNYYFQQQEFATQPYIITSLPVATAVAHRLNWVNQEQDARAFDDLVAMIRGTVSIEQIGESKLFTIKAMHSDPAKAQQIANTASDVFIERNLEKKLTTFKKSVSWLTDQLIDLEYKLEESQKELISYIETERVTSFGDQPVLPQAVTTEQELEQNRTLMQRLNSKRVEQELELQQLLQRYTEKHPKVTRLREELALTKGKIASQEKELKTQDQQRESQAIHSKQKEIKYSILKRKVDINKELYNSLIQKMKEIDIASAVNDNNIDILEYASLPTTPLRPNKARQVMLGFIIAFSAAIVLPIVLDYLDPTLRSAEEAEHFLELPVLSSITIFNSANAENKTFPALNTRSTEAEAFRILRTNLRFSFPADSGRSLLVTSSNPNEGKSTIASNLALTMAAAGSKTCLVDTDLRLPRLHKLFEMDNEIGLTNFLIGEETNIDDVVRKTPYENLYILTSGGSTPKPAELLETQAMQDTVRLLLSKFDRVIFDSPPAGNIVDASIMASYLDGVIFVLQAGKVSRGHIRMAQAQLERVKANICGVVLNKIETGKSNYYYYYYLHGEKGAAGRSRASEPAAKARG